MDETDAAHSRGEETSAEKALRDAREGYAAHYVDEQEPVDEALQGHDPRAERRALPQHDPKPASAPITADALLETWYWYRTVGRIKSAKSFEQGVGAEGQDEAMLAALYVESTPGYSDDRIKPVLLHRLDGRAWGSWYGFCSRALASAMFDAFRAALARRMESEPFVVYATRARTPDHLEQAEAANDPDNVARNDEWRRRRRLTKTDGIAAESRDFSERA